MRLLTLLLRAGLGCLLVVAGVLKLREPAAFATEIANYQLLPAVAPLLAMVLPAIEVVLGVGLLCFPRPWRRAAAAGALLVLVAFGAAVASAYFRRLDIDCGCFGTGASPITAFTLLRNTLLIAAAIALLVLDQTSRQGGGRGGPPDASTDPPGDQAGNLRGRG